MNTIFNPYLPLYEYIPDGEPHVFGDRLYVYGSHDRFGGSAYCLNDYTVWSAPLNNLSDWTNHGITYSQTSDPGNNGRLKELWAPDVCLGPDGKYYMYYCAGFSDWIGVAVADNPEGPFSYLGRVVYPDGIKYGAKKEDMPFDPAVFVDDDGRIYLYTAFCKDDFFNYLLMKTFLGVRITGKCSYVLELEKDMRTIKSVKPLIPGPKTGKGTSFEGHEFYEASSMRKYNGIYYFIYSSILSHELAYATSIYPDRDYVYRGALHSNGNIGFNGQKEASYPCGNNHGSLVKINDDYYIFGHRQTNYCECCRQGIAEKLTMDKDGLFSQAEMTSFGLNKNFPDASGKFPASIACILTKNGKAGKITKIKDKSIWPMITQKYPDGEQEESQYITNMCDGSAAGYRYFIFSGKKIQLILSISGDADGTVSVTEENGHLLGETSISISGNTGITMDFIPITGKHAVIINYSGSGHFDLYSFEFKSE